MKTSITKSAKPKTRRNATLQPVGYAAIHRDIIELLQDAKYHSARAINSIITATYWQIGRRIVEFEQSGIKRAAYGDVVIEQLAHDLTRQFGRGFGKANLWNMRAFYQAWPPEKILQTASGEYPLSKKTVMHASNALLVATITEQMLLPWSAYVRLLSVKDPNARKFYETEALHAGWSVRQLDRQINSQFYERTALSRNKTAMLRKARTTLPEDIITPEQAIKDPYVLEFLNLKDEYSETDLESALIHRLQDFLLELGNDFSFVGRQRRLRIGDEWYRIDLLFFHRRLKALIVIDLKIGKFTHADAGQMHLYLNYAREHWTLEGENPPVGLILCAQKDTAVAHYALEGLPNKVLAAEYKTILPAAEHIAKAIDAERRELETQGKTGPSTKRRATKSTDKLK